MIIILFFSLVKLADWNLRYVMILSSTDPSKILMKKSSLTSYRHFPGMLLKVFEDVNDALEAWYSLLSEVIDTHIPLKQHRVKRKNQPN